MRNLPAVDFGADGVTVGGQHGDHDAAVGGVDFAAVGDRRAAGEHHERVRAGQLDGDRFIDHAHLLALALDRRTPARRARGAGRAGRAGGARGAGGSRRAGRPRRAGGARGPGLLRR